MKTRLALVTVTLACLGACGGTDSEALRDLASLEILEIEDRRVEAGEAGEIVGRLQDEDAQIVRVAVRALGRLEERSLIPELVGVLDHPSADVRAEAANALAQATFGQPDGPVLDALLDRADLEADPRTKAALARSIGRLWIGEGEDLARRVSSLVELGRDSTPEVREGVALGLYSLARRSGGSEPRSAAVREWLEAHASDPDPRIRRVVALTLSELGGADPQIAARLLGDEDAQVRLRALALVGEDAGPGPILPMLADASGQVRTGAVAAIVRLGSPTDRCEALVPLVDDPDMHVRVAAIGALGEPCPDSGAQTERLEVIASGIGDALDRDWHPAAHALVSLAAVAPDRAAPLVRSFLQHDSYFVQAYGARAAGLVGDVALLREIAAFGHPNVRNEVAKALFELTGHEADDVLLRLIEVQDPQLVLTVARLLEGSEMGERVLAAALMSLEGLSNLRRETTRDPRLELLDRIREQGPGFVAPRLRRHLRDIDPVVAARAAEILSDWLGEPVEASPTPSPREPVPSLEELRRLREVSVVLQMVHGEIEIRLYPDDALTNAARFVRMVERGHFDGLTFHRVASNYVIQGGSPNANEYAGDALFSRDELGLRSHRRGTVGVSTRGRDTGDGQIFVNTVDNPRLDHDYTIFGEVVRGMDVVDAVREGDLIVSARVVG